MRWVLYALVAVVLLQSSSSSSSKADNAVSVANSVTNKSSELIAANSELAAANSDLIAATAGSGVAIPKFEDIQDGDLRKRAEDLNQRVDSAITDTNSHKNDSNVDRPKLLTNLRDRRLEIIRITPLLRAYSDTLRKNRAIVTDYFGGIDTDHAATLTKRIENLKSKVDTLQAQLTSAKAGPANDANGAKETPFTNFLITELADFQEQLNNATKQMDSAKQEDSNSQLRKDDAEKSMNKFEDEIQNIDHIVRSLDSGLSLIDDDSGDLLKTETLSISYTNISTIIFGLLVGGVILGFFTIAFQSDKVRDSIFTSESGIQFVTLFSLVIAIILFGVLKILEGKELAALLGGLSGYILGRGSGQTNKSGSAAPPPNPVGAGEKQMG